MRLSLLILLFSFNQLSFSASVYRWVDDQGNTHFTQKKPYQYQTKEINIPQSKIDSEAAKVRLNKQLDSFKTRRDDSKLRKEKGSQAITNKNKMQAYCKGITSSLSVLKSSGPIKAEGAKSNMTNEQRKQSLASYQLKFTANCK